MTLPRLQYTLARRRWYPDLLTVTLTAGGLANFYFPIHVYIRSSYHFDPTPSSGYVK